MTHNDVVDKTDTFGASKTGRRDFLNALYKGSPDNLYLELRCIHPTSGEARSLWGQMGNKPELGKALKQAETLNREGYGVYFAPCLRKAKQKLPHSFPRCGWTSTAMGMPMSATRT